MKSTGEAIGYDRKLHRALYKALQASGMQVAGYGTVLVTVADEDTAEALPLDSAKGAPPLWKPILCIGDCGCAAAPYGGVCRPQRYFRVFPRPQGGKIHKNQGTGI